MLAEAYAAWGGLITPWMPWAVGVAVIALPAGIALIVWGRGRRQSLTDSSDEDFVSYEHGLLDRLVRGLALFVGSIITCLGLVAAIVAVLAAVLGSR